LEEEGAIDIFYTAVEVIGGVYPFVVFLLERSAEGKATEVYVFCGTRKVGPTSKELAIIVGNEIVKVDLGDGELAIVVEAYGCEDCVVLERETGAAHSDMGVAG